MLATLFLVGLSCLVLGMGMNTVAAFLLVSVIGTPALVKHGIDPFVANMFVFYFALLSHITPPVCLAIFAGAQVAEANIWETAFMGVKMSAVPYVLPYLVVFAPTLLLIGDTTDIILDTAAVAIGFGFIIVCIQGWFLERIGALSRLMAGVAGVGLIMPSWTGKGIGLAVAVVTLVLLLARKRQTSAA